MNLMMLFIGDFTYPTRVLKPLLKLSLILSTPSDSPFFISFTLLTALDFILSIFSVTRFLISSNFFFIFDKKSVIPSKDKYKSTKFQDIHSYQIELAKEVIAGNGAPFNFIPFTKKERELFEKYMDSGSYILDFFDSNEQHILEEYLSLSKTQA